MGSASLLTPADLALAHARAALARQGTERQLASSPETVLALGLGTVQVGGAAALYATAVPWATANTIVHLGLDHPATRPDLRQLSAPFLAHLLPFTVSLSPLAQPDALPGWLQEAGLTEQAPHWVFDLPLNTNNTDGPGPETSVAGLPTEWLTARQQPDFARVILGEDAPAELLAYVARPPAPNMFRYGVFLGGQLIAAAQMTVVGRLAHFSGAATLPAFRGRGAQGALLQRRLADAVSAGCSQATVEVSANNGASLRNVERAGFRRRYQECFFLWTPPEIHPSV